MLLFSAKTFLKSRNLTKKKNHFAWNFARIEGQPKHLYCGHSNILTG